MPKQESPGGDFAAEQQWGKEALQHLRLFLTLQSPDLLFEAITKTFFVLPPRNRWHKCALQFYCYFTVSCSNQWARSVHNKTSILLWCQWMHGIKWQLKRFQVGKSIFHSLSHTGLLLIETKLNNR